MNTFLRSKLFRFAAILLSLNFLACSGEGKNESPHPAEAPGLDQAQFILAAEFMSYPEMEALLGDLARYDGVALCPAIRAEEQDSPELASLISASAKKGVPLIAWLLAPEAEGYWFSETNIESAANWTYSFVDILEEKNLQIAALMFDMELQLDLTLQLKNSSSVTDVVGLLSANIDPPNYQKSKTAYAELVAELKNRGYAVTAAAYPFLMNDAADGNENIADAFNAPVVGVGFDEIYFMAYRTTFRSLLGIEAGPDLVFQLGSLAADNFGAAGVLALGTIGSPGMVSSAGFTDPAELAADIAAARAAGNNKVFIFSLDGMVEQGGLDIWLSKSATPAEKPPGSATTRLILGLIDTLDSLLMIE